MAISIQQYAEALHEALQETDNKSHDLVIDNFIKVLKTNDDLDKYDKIVEAYEAHTAKEASIVHAEVISAKPAEHNKDVIDALNKIAGKDVRVTHKVNEDLIGGVVIRMDDTMIDASVKGQLDRLKKTLRE